MEVKVIAALVAIQSLLVLNVKCYHPYIQKCDGEICIEPTTKKEGICTVIENCPTALKAIENKERVTICNFKNLATSVCCVKEIIKGEICITEGRSGRCESLFDCEPVLDAFRNKRNYTECNNQYVCCPNEVITTMKPLLGLSGRKCEEYGKAVYDEDGYSVCAQFNSIVGGEDAGQNEFPHMALIGYGNNSSKSWSCGGSLISERFVLTAAHCLFSRDLGEARYIRLGETNIAETDDDSDIQDFLIERSYRHPEYKPPVKYNDIALLKLNEDAQFNRAVRPACLHLDDDSKDRIAIATGWGSVDFQAATSNTLLKVNLIIYPYDNCSETYASESNRALPFGIARNRQICAGGFNERKDTCNGDSGGPLQISHPTEYCMYSVMGVTSFGKLCGVINTPGVYTKVSSYVDWIENIVWPNEN